MCPQWFSIRRLSILAVAMLFSIGLATVTVAQSQEPKPALPATPVAPVESPVSSDATTGVSGSSWQGPNYGVRIHWDPAVWSVEGESIAEDYDGLQIGTPISTVFLEAYSGFDGDADACFAAAEQEITEREGVSEVVPITACRRRRARGSGAFRSDRDPARRDQLPRRGVCRVPDSQSGRSSSRDY